MVVHHVEVDEVGAGAQHGVDLFAQAREVGGQDRGAIQGACMSAKCTRARGRPG